MQYYRVEFLAANAAGRPAKTFRTQEMAEKHARRVLGMADGRELASKVNIISVNRDKTPL
jgi:hypothetical protein